MNIRISYAEMSFLRELVKNKQLEIWRELFLPEFEGLPSNEIDKAFNKLMNPIYDIPLTNRACCAKLLKIFETEEKKIKKALTKAEQHFVRP
jgi:hypothetical protein